MVMAEIDKNIMIKFCQSIKDYEHESGHSIYQDERSAEEFIELFLDSADY